MKQPAGFLGRHRHLLMIALMTVTLLAGSIASRRRPEGDASATSLPVSLVQTTAADSVAVFVTDRDAAYQRDVAALTAIVEQADVADRTRQEAAAQLTALVADRQARQALEDALSATSLAPCAAVVSGGSVTIVTAKAAPDPEDMTLVMTLAATHAGIPPQNVRILSAE